MNHQNRSQNMKKLMVIPATKSIMITKTWRQKIPQYKTATDSNKIRKDPLNVINQYNINNNHNNIISIKSENRTNMTFPQNTQQISTLLSHHQHSHQPQQQQQQQFTDLIFALGTWLSMEIQLSIITTIPFLNQIIPSYHHNLYVIQINILKNQSSDDEDSDEDDDEEEDDEEDDDDDDIKKEGIKQNLNDKVITSRHEPHGHHNNNNNNNTTNSSSCNNNNGHNNSSNINYSILEYCPNYVAYDTRARKESKERISSHLRERQKLVIKCIDAAITEIDKLV